MVAKNKEAELRAALVKATAALSAVAGQRLAGRDLSYAQAREIVNIGCTCMVPLSPEDIYLVTKQAHALGGRFAELDLLDKANKARAKAKKGGKG